MNVIFLDPGFPASQRHFVRALRSPESLALIKRLACSIDRDGPARTLLD